MTELYTTLTQPLYSPVGFGQEFTYYDGSTNWAILINEYDFNAAGKNNLLGYSRNIKDDSQAEISYTIHGQSVYKDPLYDRKYEFGWSLMLAVDKAAYLEAMIDAQAKAVATRSPLADQHIVLNDGRMRLVESTVLSPRKRKNTAAITPSGYPILSSIVTVNNDQNLSKIGEAFFPVFKVYMTVKAVSQPFVYTDGQWLVTMDLYGKETDFVPA
jgi:hypothetical protein